MEFELLIDAALHKFSLEKKGSSYFFSDEKGTFEVDIRPVSENAFSLLVNGASRVIYVAGDRKKKYVFLDGQQFLIQEPGQEGRQFLKGEDKSLQADLFITAPMPGKVIKINVSEQEAVRKNQTLAIVEAMKMENEIKASIEAVVKKVFVQPGDLVDSEKPLIELEPKK